MHPPRVGVSPAECIQRHRVIRVTRGIERYDRFER